MGALDRFRLESDSWLSGILERPSWRVADGGSGTALSELYKPGANFAYAKVGAGETALAESLQSFGFRVVDTALTLDAQRVDAPAQSDAVRFAEPGDRSAVEAIAGSAFRYSRFHLDPAFPRSLADKVKAAWAGNWFLGKRGDGMVVAKGRDGAVAGFLQLKWAKEGALVIDLIAVDARHVRQGLACAMIGFAWARGTGDSRRPRTIIVGTQAANIPSLRLYESLGFRLCDAKFVLHHHGAKQ